MSSVGQRAKEQERTMGELERKIPYFFLLQNLDLQVDGSWEGGQTDRQTDKMKTSGSEREQELNGNVDLSEIQ